MADERFPTDWTQSSIGNEFDIATGFTLNANRKPVQNRRQYLRVANVQRGEISLDDLAELEAEADEFTARQLQADDLLIVEGHADPLAIGRCARVPPEAAGLTFQNHLYRLRSRGVEVGFATHWLNSEFARRYWQGRCATSSGLHTINQRMLRSLPIPIPPLPEQRAVAAVLDAADAAIDRTRAAVAAARRLKRGLVQALLTRGVGPGGRIRDPDREPEAFAATRLGTFPRSWELVRVRDVAALGSGVTLGKDLSGIKAVELPYLRVANVQDGYIDTTEMKTVRVPEADVSQYRLEPGDVLMTEGGDFDKLGRGGVWDGRIDPCLHQNHVFRVRPNRSRLDPHYLGAVIGSGYGKRYFMRIAKRTTNLASINKTQLNAFPFPLPPLAEQQHIVRLLSAAERHIAAAERSAATQERLKRGLMQALLTGRVRVPAGGGGP